MDKNSIDIKIREFAIYLKDFGLLNETNINDFFKTFLNKSEKNSAHSLNYKNDINLELIYLKENLSKAMFEFFNIMTEERKRIIYLNIYSKFLQKREKDLYDKGNFLYKKYCSLFSKKYFNKWKGLNSNNNINNENKNKVLKTFQNLQKDNFCFDIISGDNLTQINNDLIINSNNHKIIFKSNTSSTSKNISSVNSYTDINSLILSTKNTVFNNNNNIILNPNNFKNKLFENNKQSINNKYQTLNNSDKKKVIYERFEQKMKEEKLETKKKNSKKYQSQIIKQSNKNVTIKNKNNNLNSENIGKKVKKQFIKLIEKEKNNNQKEINIQPMRKTYNSDRPISNFNYDEYNKKNVYRRLYEQNIEYNKRKAQRIEENIKEIKERANHPIIKNNSFNKFKTFRNNYQNKDKNKNKFIKRNKITLLENKEKQKIFKNNCKTMENMCLVNDKEKRYSSFDNNIMNNKNDIDKKKEIQGKFFMENQRKCIELFNEMIKNEEKKAGKKFEETIKEKLFKELLNKMYHENEGNKDENGNKNEDDLDEDNV